MKSRIRNRIFELLKELSESQSHSGLLIVFSDLTNVLAKGALPIGVKSKTFKDFDEVGHIYNEEAAKILKKVGIDGAVMVDEEGKIYSPSVYLNVNVLGIDKSQLETEFAARHIAALAISTSTDASVYALSEETSTVREFIGGKVRRRHPSKREEKVLEIIKKDLQASQTAQESLELPQEESPITKENSLAVEEYSTAEKENLIIIEENPQTLKEEG
ncbi:MAG: diadenylate cyclase [Nanoarchaeota archaeon]